MIEPQPRFQDYLGLEGHAARTPAAIALAAPGRKPLTYAGLWGQLRAIHGAVSRAGFRTGDVAALAMSNGPELITAYLGVSSIGACAPLNPAFTETEFRLYLGRLGARILIVNDCGDSVAVAAGDLGRLDREGFLFLTGPS